MAVASGPAGLVLAGPVLSVSDFKTAHAQVITVFSLGPFSLAGRSALVTGS